MKNKILRIILTHIIALLCGIGFITILYNKNIINTFDSLVFLCLLFCVYLCVLVYTLMKIKLSWLLVFKAFITLFWFLGMLGFIVAAINNQKTFLELLAHCDKALIFMVILLGCLSIILDFFFKEKKIMIYYFLIIFFAYNAFFLSVYVWNTLDF